jgi:formate/nitrite transporter FocA (FNT family)
MADEHRAGDESSSFSAAEKLQDTSPADRKAIDQQSRPNAALIHETIRAEGESELERTVPALLLSGLAAGLTMGFSLVAEGLLRTHLPDAPWRDLIAHFGYTVGFLIVVLGRQQLFTENTLTPILPLLYHRDAVTLGRVARLWAAVLVANVVGTWIFAQVIAHTEVFTPAASPSSRSSTTARSSRRSSDVRRAHAFAAPTVSAILAPRVPSGSSGPCVVSCAVWCSLSALISAPSRTMIVESQIQVMKPMAAPSEP